MTQLEKENRILRTSGVLHRTRFTWKRSPIKVLREKLGVVGLQLDVFKEESILFNQLKNCLDRKFRVGEFLKYHTLIELINQNDLQWQIHTIWEVLFNVKPGEECYGLLETFLYDEKVANVNQNNCYSTGYLSKCFNGLNNFILFSV